MPLHDELLSQADALVRLEPRKPKQATLRRGISTAYYALFHLLVSEAASSLASYPPLRDRIARALKHGAMNDLCKKLPRLDQDLRKGLKGPDPLLSVFVGPLEPQILSVAKAFVNLQEARHQADYDPTYRASRAEAGRLVLDAQRTFVFWRAVRREKNARIFLAALVLEKKLVALGMA